MKEEKDLTLIREENMKAKKEKEKRETKEALARYNEREEGFRQRKSDSFFNINYNSLSEREKDLIKRAFHYIISHYDTKIRFDMFGRAMMASIYDIK
jgi:hypothetical protein